MNRKIVSIWCSLLSLVFIAACSEEHPDNLPGAVNNPYPDVSVDASSTAIIDPFDDAMTYSIPVEFSRAAPADGELNFRATSGTALPGRDYEEPGNRITFSEGQQLVNIPVTLINDSTRLSARDFRIELTGATNAQLSENNRHTVTIAAREDINDNADPAVLNTPAGLNLRMPTPDRSPLSYPIVFTFSEPLQEAASLQWRTLENSALAGVHFENVDATGDNAVAIDAGAREFAIELELLHDPELAENVNFQLQLVSAEGFILPDERLINVEIVNSNPEGVMTPLVSLPGDVVYHEPLQATDYELYLPLSEAMSDIGTLRVSLVELSARDQVDFVAYTDVIEVPVHSTEVTVPVRLLYNPEQTADRDFRVELSAPSNLTLPSERNFTVRIADSGNRPPEPLLQLTPNLIRVPTPANTMESQEITLYFELSEILQSDGTLTIRSRNGSAAAGIDFDEVAMVNQSVSEGSDGVEVSINLHPTTSDEPREFELVFSQPDGIRLPENRSVTVQIDPRNTPIIPELQVPSDEVIITAPENLGDCADNDQPQDFCYRRIILPFSDYTPLRGQLQITSQDKTARNGFEFTLIEDLVPFAMGVREAVVLLQVEPTDEITTFELILQSATNLQLPDTYEDRVVTVVIEPY